MDDNEEPEDENEVKTKRDLLAASSDSDEGELASDILGGRKSTYEKRQEKVNMLKLLHKLFAAAWCDCFYRNVNTLFVTVNIFMRYTRPVL